MMIPEPPKDITPPKAPVVNKVLRKAKTLTGKAEIGSKITVKSGKIIIGTGIVNSKGIYSVKIKPQKVKSVLLVTAMDQYGNISKATTVVVK
jgi:bacillopeptidase F